MGLCGDAVVEVEGATLVDVAGSVARVVLRLEVEVDSAAPVVVVVVDWATRTSGGSPLLVGDVPRAVIVVPRGPSDESDAAAIDDAARTNATIHARARGDGM